MSEISAQAFLRETPTPDLAVILRAMKTHPPVNLRLLELVKAEVFNRRLEAL